MNTPADCVTYAEAEAALGVPHKWLRRLAAAGLLKVVRLGHRTVYIRRSELARVISLFENKPRQARAQLAPSHD